LSLSITECIELAEAALDRPNNSARHIAFGLHNNSTIYSDQIRVSMENLRASNLVHRI
jgi:hypothetical protein